MTVQRDLPQLQALLAGAQLPALPLSALRLLELAQDPENSPADFAIPVESDPGLAAQFLRFVNSSHFGFSHKISSIKQAISLVGTRVITDFGLWNAVFSSIPNPMCRAFKLKSLWQDSLRRAVFARSFGKLLGLADAENLFAAALLQDMAIPLLVKELPNEYVAFFDRPDGGQTPLSVLESSAFGWTHADAGALIARGWKLPDKIASLIESHCSLVEYLDAPSQASRDAVTVSLSSLLPSSVAETWHERERFIAACKQLTTCDAMPDSEFFVSIDAEFAAIAPAMRLGAVAKPLGAWFDLELETANKLV